MGWDIFYQLTYSSVLASGIVSVFILIKGLIDFSRTGPIIKDEILKSYRFYSIYAISRLVFWCFLINLFLAITGNLFYYGFSVMTATSPTVYGSFIAALLAIVFFTIVQFLKDLLFIPSNIALSSHYSMKNFYKIWSWLSPRKLQLIAYCYKSIFLFVMLAAIYSLYHRESVLELMILLSILVVHLSIYLWSTCNVPVGNQTNGKNNPAKNRDMPNIIMIGSDTLRTDRIGRKRDGKSITPHIDKLISKSIYFKNCYVPIARTAPSLVSLFTGILPWKHKIRDNFAEHDDINLVVEPFAKLLQDKCYSTAVISDWCGTDFGKFALGFEKQDLPEDQWNIRYYIRQGPKDMRLFLSLFIKNRLGRSFLPEIFYLGGVPQGDYLLNKTKQWLSDLSQGDSPFLLNTFFSTTHPPFGSEYPYYSMYADKEYWGESKFNMAKLTDPAEIIRSQKEPKEAFDLDQIIDLYDGTVTNFDDQVGEILSYIEENNLEKNTIVVIYSDHGMEFFENDTWGQGNSIISEFSNKIPLIIYDPETTEGQTNLSTVRSVDLVPTLLDMILNEVNDDYDGVSLKEIIQIKDHIDLDVLAETGIWFARPPGMLKEHLSYPDLLDIITVKNKKLGTIVLKTELKEKIYRAKDRVLISGEWKLIRFSLENGFLYQLFDREDDPNCKKDISEMHPDVLNELKIKMNQCD